MAVVSRIATISFTNNLGAGRDFVATAATQDTAAGSSVVVTVTNTGEGGALDPANPDTFTLRYVTDDGTTIKTVTLNTSSASQTDTFFFTDTGLTGGAARCGTVEIKLQATKTTGGPTATYDYETDGSPSTPPTGFTADQVDRGWIRGTTTLVEAVSNVALGGTKSTPAQHDESLFVRTTCGAASYVARSFTVASSAGSLSAATNSTTSATRDVTFASVVDERFAAASTVVGWTVTASNATLTGLPWTVFSSTTDDTITVDPRNTASVVFQLDDNTYGTPPSSKDDAARQRLNTQQAFIGVRVVGSRGVGINGLTVSLTLTPTLPGSPESATGLTTSTQGGEAGWTDSFLAWDNSLPGGTWTLAIDVTAPADIDDAAYLLGSSVTFTMLAVDPTLRPVLRISASDSVRTDHLKEGDVMAVETWLLSTTEQANVLIDGAPALWFSKVTGDGVSSKAQHWNGTAWVDTGAGMATSFAATQSTSDPRVWFYELTINTVFGPSDFVAVVKMTKDGTPYSDLVMVELVGGANQHDSYGLDPIALALAGVISQR